MIVWSTAAVRSLALIVVVTVVLGACSDSSSSTGSLSATGPDATPDLDAAGSIDGFADEADAGAVEDGEVEAGDAGSAQDVLDEGGVDADATDVGAADDGGTPNADANPDADLDSATEPDACVPSCAGATCGDDGCGGSCGACPPGSVCAGGQCAEQPGCENDNECGGAYPQCFGGVCVQCLQAAQCPGGYSCTAQHECVCAAPPCVEEPECVGDEQCGGDEPACVEGYCVECEGDGGCVDSFACNLFGQCVEVVPTAFQVEVTWNHPHGAHGHLVDLGVPVENDDLDGDGQPDPYSTDADCYAGHTGTCGFEAFGASEVLWLDEPAPNLYEVAVQLVEAMPPDAEVEVGVAVQFAGDEPVQFNQALVLGDLWCVVVVDPVAKTITPCVDGEGNPKVTADYPVSGE